MFLKSAEYRENLNQNQSLYVFLFSPDYVENKTEYAAIAELLVVLR